MKQNISEGNVKQLNNKMKEKMFNTKETEMYTQLTQ